MVVAALIVIGTVGLGGRAVGGTTDPSGGAAEASYVVQPGDTLWELARSRVGPDGDPRPLVDLIRERNALPTSALQVGDRLWLPAG